MTVMATGLTIFKSGLLFISYLFTNLFSYLFPPSWLKKSGLIVAPRL